MRSAVDDVHERDGKRPRILVSEPAVERNTGVGCSGLRRSERAPEDGVRAEPALRPSAVERDESLVQCTLIVGIEPDDGIRDVSVDVRDRPQHAPPDVHGRVAVAKFDGLVLPGRGSGRHDCASERARLEPNVDLDGRVAAGVEELASVDVRDRGHERDPRS